MAKAPLVLQRHALPRRRSPARTVRSSHANLSPGWFTISVSADGYLLGAAGKLSPWDVPSGLELSAGERLTGITVKLWQPVTISGTVRDDRGDPVIQAPVRALTVNYRGGRRDWTDVTALRVPVRTDDLGRYRITNLQPGSYTVVVPSQATGAQLDASSARGGLIALLGGSRSLRDAEVLTLQSGEHRTGVDLYARSQSVSKSDGVRVYGRVTHGQPLSAPLLVRLVPQDAIGVGATFEELSTTSDLEGRFDFSLVPEETIGFRRGSFQRWKQMPLGLPRRASRCPEPVRDLNALRPRRRRGLLTCRHLSTRLSQS